MIHVLVTRAEPGLSRSVAALREAGFDPISLPLFEVIDTGAPVLESPDQNFIFTSANAPEILRRRNWCPPNPNACAWCVGDRTAQAARDIGFVNVRSASGGGSRLVQQISEFGYRTGSRFHYLTTPDRSYDIAGALVACGYDVGITEIYRVDAINPTEDAFVSAMTKICKGALLIYSKRSGDGLMRLIKEHIVNVNTREIVTISISKAASAGLSDLEWRGIYTALEPNENSMINRLNDIFSCNA